ncbi:MAG: ABC transporter substrate-binding protein [Acidimicrobiales bacterium]
MKDIGITRRTSLPLRRLLALLAVPLLIASACATKSSPKSEGNAGPPKAGGTLTIGLDAETDGWNPTASQWAAPSYYVAEAIFDPLVTFGADNKTHPYLAESITPNADFTQWTIKLRPGITFQDGEPLNADALKLQLDKDKASFLVGQLLHPLQSTDKVDDLTVRVNMSEPWVAFPAAMASQAGFMAAPKQLNATGADATDHPIGTGPYVFKEWARDDHLTATKNPNYWRKGTPYPDQVVFRVIPDDQSRLASLQSKQIDLMYTGAASVIMQARGDKSLRMKEADTDPTTMIMLNNAVAPTDDLRVRQALSLATDTKQLISTVGQGLAKQADGPYLPDSPWYAPSGYPLSPDLNKARSLLDAYKQDHNISGDLKFTVGCTPTPTNTQSMELLKTQWAKVGVDITLKYTEQATYINDAVTGNFQANCWAQLGATDPDLDALWWLSANAAPVGSIAVNFMRLKDPQIDTALETGRHTDDVAQRKAAYAEVWKRLAADVPYVWLTHGHIAVISSGRVHGVGTGKLPDGAAPLLYKGEVPQVVPLLTLWVDQ